jgi:hypothetical protein
LQTVQSSYCTPRGCKLCQFSSLLPNFTALLSLLLT